MLKFKITCPKCGAVVATSIPEALIWERCPGCRVHVWERYDVLMADVNASARPIDFAGSGHTNN